MRIAILGSAPSSLNLAPFSDPSFQIWACSPGTYSQLPRCDEFFELHRWEPGEVGKAATQKPWFSPEYVAWMGKQKCVWMYQPVPEIPNSKAIPVEEITKRYGTYFFTSTIAFMIAGAIDDIMADRETRETDEQDVIALFGVDMAANEEYGYQRAGCQHFLCLAADLGIQVYVPPESDLLRPMPLYGISESSHWMIKATSRKRELEGRLANANNMLAQATHDIAFLQGALDDLNYHMLTWGEDRQGMGVSHELLAKSPLIRKVIDMEKQNDIVSHPTFAETGDDSGKFIKECAISACDKLDKMPSKLRATIEKKKTKGK